MGRRCISAAAGGDSHGAVPSNHAVGASRAGASLSSHLSVGSAVLSLSGTLVLHDIVLHDTGELAQQPLVTAREVDAAFGWAELLSPRIRGKSFAEILSIVSGIRPLDEDASDQDGK